jgi:hypothetical protein
LVCGASLFGSCSLVVFGNLAEFERVLCLSKNLSVDDAPINLSRSCYLIIDTATHRIFKNQSSSANVSLLFNLFCLFSVFAIAVHYLYTGVITFVLLSLHGIVGVTDYLGLDKLLSLSVVHNSKQLLLCIYA